MRGVKIVVAAAAAFAVVAAAPRGARSEGAGGAAPPVGKIVTVAGAVEVGTGGVWTAAAAGAELFEAQVLRTGANGAVEVLFAPATPARVGEKAEIAVADLLLKARLEATKARLTAPSDATRADMQLTPLTGVRGTEKSEEKAGDLKREHYWSEGPAPAAQ